MNENHVKQVITYINSLERCEHLMYWSHNGVNFFGGMVAGIGLISSYLPEPVDRWPNILFLSMVVCFVTCLWLFERYSKKADALKDKLYEMLDEESGGDDNETK